MKGREYAAEAITPDAGHARSWRVTGGTKPYRVTEGINGGWGCDCPWATYHPGIGCRHIKHVQEGIMAKAKAEVTVREPARPVAEAAPGDITDAQIDLIRRTVCQGATDDELALYLHDCRRRGVHPLDKLLHFTKRQGRYTPVTSIDLFRSQAEATGCHAGTDDAVFAGADGKFPGEATVTVYRLVGGSRCPFTATARWSEYYPGDGLGFMWKKMPHTMLSKCAEALALRKAFPKQLGGLYTREELPDDAPQVTPPAQAKPAPDVIEATKAAPAPAPAKAATPSSESRALCGKFITEIARAKTPAFLLHVGEEIARNKDRFAPDQLAAMKDAYSHRNQALIDEAEERAAIQGELIPTGDDGPYRAA